MYAAFRKRAGSLKEIRIKGFSFGDERDCGMFECGW